MSSPGTPWDAELRGALEAAAAGAQELRERYRPGGVRDTASSKGARRNLVTAADHAAEAAVLASLRRSFPADAVVAEESAAAASDADRYWCVDPLDGTNNFAHGIPIFCVSIGLVVEGVPRVGVVHAPLLGEVYETAGDEVRLNGAGITVSSTAELADAVVATGFAYDRNTLPDDNTTRFRAVLMRCRGMRRCGSAALDLAWVAAGRLDAYWESWLNSWDIAAGAALVRAAGGRVTDLDGADGWLRDGVVAATNGPLHGELLSVLAAAADAPRGA